MFTDLISYCDNIETLRAELIDKDYIEEETNKPILPLHNKTPIQNMNTPKTVTLIRCVSDEDIELLNTFDSLEVLGTKKQVDIDHDKTVKYESVYSRDPIISTNSETGEEFTYTPPKWHGDFL